MADTSQLTFDSVGADAARRDGMDRADAAERVQAWKATAAVWLAARTVGHEFTADDLVEAVGLPDRPSQGQNRNNVVGALIASWSTAGKIEWTGRWKPSARAVGHRNPQRVWRRR